MPDPSRLLSQEACSPRSHSHQVRGPWTILFSATFSLEQGRSLLLWGWSMGAEYPGAELALTSAELSPTCISSPFVCLTLLILT